MNPSSHPIIEYNSADRISSSHDDIQQHDTACRISCSYKLEHLGSAVERSHYDHSRSLLAVHSSDLHSGPLVSLEADVAQCTHTHAWLLLEYLHWNKHLDPLVSLRVTVWQFVPIRAYKLDETLDSHASLDPHGRCLRAFQPRGNCPLVPIREVPSPSIVYSQLLLPPPPPPLLSNRASVDARHVPIDEYMLGPV